MAWQYPKHSCGHDGERYQAYGPGRNREYQLKKIEAEPCPKCRAEQADASCAELPPLRGSEKQIAWASEMRAAALSNPARTIAEAGVPDDLIPHAQRVLAEWGRQESSRWWIDGRYSRNLKSEAATLARADEIAAKL